MVTALVSDFHLGTPMSVLRNTDARSRLLQTLADADQVVLLGDVVDLRYRPLAQVLATARPILEELGRAVGGRRVVLVPGNHDHQLAAPVLEPTRLAGAPLGLEQVVDGALGGAAGALADMLGSADVAVAYPGLWVRPDVYATHGHYLDCHATVPRPEVVLAGALQRRVGGMPARPEPGDYEAVLAPLYSFAYELAQAPRRRHGPDAAGRAWHLFKVAGWRIFESRTGRLGTFRDGLVTSVAVAGLNRLGIGRFGSDLSSEELGRATLAAMGEVVRRLGIDAAYVVFGHTHRPGPVAGAEGWTLPGGTRLLNSGSWGVSPTPPESPGPDPYRPGTCILVGETGPPEARSLLDDVPPDDLLPEALLALAAP